MIITGDGTRYYSAPLECRSVANVKEELRRSRSGYCLRKCPQAGTVFLAATLERRLLTNKTFQPEAFMSAASVYFNERRVRNEPVISAGEHSKDYFVDARDLIDDFEYDLWRDEEAELHSTEALNRPVYEIYVVSDNV